MSKRNKTFIELCLEGAADLSDIDDYIEKWHMSDEDTSIYEYIGMKKEEYIMWMKNPRSLRFILFSRKFQMPCEEALDQIGELPLAARAKDIKEFNGVLKWLRMTGRL